MDKNEALKLKIVSSFQQQGFYANGHVSPALSTKAHLKLIHELTRNEQITLQKDFLEKNFDIVSKYFLKTEINPENISLELREVLPGSLESIIYRWWNLAWWSVPYQKSYGRQMRFLLWDKTHNAPFGIIGLQSPILKMAVRDNFLKIPKAELDFWINMSMQAQRLGALPPYNQLIGGKMVAMSLTSNELRKRYSEKYDSYKTIIKDRAIKSNLLFITTTSAFGRISIYNRLNYNKEPVAYILGFTKGSGSFHVTQELYTEIKSLLIDNNVNINTGFGNGPSRKIKLLEKAFTILNLKEYHYHNIQREFFFFPLAENYRKVIEEGEDVVYFDRPLTELTEYWKERWAIKRANNEDNWKHFSFAEFTEKIQKEFNLTF